MKYLKNILTTLVFAVAMSTTVQAQNMDSLIGKWTTTYNIEGETIETTYEFKKVDGTLKVYTVQHKNSKGQVQKESELVMNTIAFKNKKGTCKYILKYEGKIYNIPSDFVLKDDKTLELSYSYYGYSDTEIWKRINKD
jgi:hypothetical protein